MTETDRPVTVNDRPMTDRPTSRQTDRQTDSPTDSLTRPTPPTSSKKRKHSNPKAAPNSNNDFEVEFLKRFDTINADPEDHFDAFGKEIARGVRSINGDLEQEMVMRQMRDIIFKVKFGASALASCNANSQPASAVCREEFHVPNPFPSFTSL